MSIFAWVALLLGLLGVTLLVLLITSEKKLQGPRLLRLGVVTLSGAAAYKLLAFFGIFVVPAATLGAAHIEMIEGATTVESCGKCHVMTPMLTDMFDPTSDSLAARHFKNGYIRDNQCYQCHSGYGFNGAFAAKLEGYRHLVRYTTSTYEEPIKMRASFDAKSCLSCHLGTEPFNAINSHQVALARLSSGQMSCINCHGPAHPTRTERTPGSSDYERLMAGPVDQVPPTHSPTDKRADLAVNGPVSLAPWPISKEEEAETEKETPPKPIPAAAIQTVPAEATKKEESP